jgi:mannose-6-phosphate isomerase-like protein (cupin superfamily)
LAIDIWHEVREGLGELSLPEALKLPRTPGRSTEVSRDGDLEIRFAAKPANGPQVPRQRDEFYVVAAGTVHYRVEDRVTEVGPGDLLFAAAHVAHGFENISPDFCVWVVLGGPEKLGVLSINSYQPIEKNRADASHRSGRGGLVAA